MWLAVIFWHPKTSSRHSATTTKGGKESAPGESVTGARGKRRRRKGSGGVVIQRAPAACALRFFKTKSALRFVVCAHTHARLERGGRVRRLRSTRTAVSIWNTFTQSPIVFLVLGLWQLCDSLVRKRIFLKGVKSCGMVKWTVRAQRSGVGGTSQLLQYYNIHRSNSTFSSLTSVLQIVFKLAESENGKEGNTWKKLFLVSSTWDSIGVHT